MGTRACGHSLGEGGTIRGMCRRARSRRKRTDGEEDPERVLSASLILHSYPKISKDIQRYPMISKGIHRRPWVSIGVQGDSKRDHHGKLRRGQTCVLRL